MKDSIFVIGRHLGLNTEFPLKNIIPSREDRNRNNHRIKHKQLLPRTTEMNN